MPLRKGFCYHHCTDGALVLIPPTFTLICGDSFQECDFSHGITWGFLDVSCANAVSFSRDCNPSSKLPPPGRRGPGRKPWNGFRWKDRSSGQSRMRRCLVSRTTPPQPAYRYFPITIVHLGWAGTGLADGKVGGLIYRGMHVGSLERLQRHHRQLPGPRLDRGKSRSLPPCSLPAPTGGMRRAGGREVGGMGGRTS